MTRQNGELALNDRVRAIERQLSTRESQLERLSRDIETISAAISTGLRRRVRIVARLKNNLSANVAAVGGADARRDLAIMEECVHDAEALIGGVLDLIEVARKPLAPTDIDLTEMALSIFEQLNTSDSNSGINSAIETTVQPGMTAYGDATLVGLALKMLVVNARQANRGCTEAGIAVGVSKLRDDVVYYVRDNGMRCNAVHVPQRRNGWFDDADLHLAIVERIVERHGGRMWIDGDQGVGTTCYFTLPQSARVADSETARE